MDFLTSMFPTLDKGVIQDVFNSQNNDVDKTIDELLTLAVGDDIFARSQFIEERLSASQNLAQYNNKQQEILQQCQLQKQEEERKLAEQKRLEDQRRLEQQRILEQRRLEQQKVEEQRRLEQQKVEEQLRLEQIKLEQQRKIEEENKQKIEAERKRKQQEEEAAKLAARRREAAIEKERQKAAEEAEEAKRKVAELEERIKKAEELRKQTEEENIAAKKALEEKQRILEEKEAREKELERIKQEEANRKEPKVTIYTRKQQIIEGIDQDKIVKEIKELFTNNGINEDEILINDVSSDMELASYLKEICKQDEIQYPLVCAGNLPIGGIKRVQALVDNKKILQQLIDGEYLPEFLTEEQTNSLKDGTGVFVGQGVFDHCLDAAEYVLSGVSTILWSPVTILTYPFRSAKEELKKGDEDFDFDIVHTNWYWRNLKRRFRFTKDSILRIHPTLNDVRASHPYTTIEIVRIMDDKSIIINYKDRSAPDHVTGTEEVISSMIELIKIRSASHNCKPIFINQAEL